MKNNYPRVLVFGIVTAVIFLSVALSSKSGGTNNAALDTALYQRLYFGQLTSGLAMNTAVLTRMDHGDYQTAKNVLIISLKSDLDRMNLETNHPWSDQDKKVKALVEQYLKQNGTK